jgi:hypothetical protein
MIIHEPRRIGRRCDAVVLQTEQAWEKTRRYTDLGRVGRHGGAPSLMDGGGVSAQAPASTISITGEWEVENIGVAPDIGNRAGSGR